MVYKTIWNLLEIALSLVCKLIFVISRGTIAKGFYIQYVIRAKVDASLSICILWKRYYNTSMSSNSLDIQCFFSFVLMHLLCHGLNNRLQLRNSISGCRDLKQSLPIRNEGDMPLPTGNRKNKIFSVIYLTDTVIFLWIFKDPCDIGF